MNNNKIKNTLFFLFFLSNHVAAKVGFSLSRSARVREEEDATPSRPCRRKEEIQMPSVTNVGGSLSSALAVTALAAALRLLKNAAGRFRSGDGDDDYDDVAHGGRSRRGVGRYFAPISPTSLRMLVRVCRAQLGARECVSSASKKRGLAKKKEARHWFFSRFFYLVLPSPFFLSHSKLEPPQKNKIPKPDRHVPFPLRALRRQATGRSSRGGSSRRGPRGGPQGATCVLDDFIFFLRFFFSTSFSLFRSSLTPRSSFS